jgi:hypothetical protein
LLALEHDREKLTCGLLHERRHGEQEAVYRFEKQLSLRRQLDDRPLLSGDRVLAAEIRDERGTPLTKRLSCLAEDVDPVFVILRRH